jgi:hypothetical protein
VLLDEMHTSNGQTIQLQNKLNEKNRQLGALLEQAAERDELQRENKKLRSLIITMQAGKDLERTVFEAKLSSLEVHM